MCPVTEGPEWKPEIICLMKHTLGQIDPNIKILESWKSAWKYSPRMKIREIPDLNESH